MKALTGSDSSILAYLASEPRISTAERKRLVAQLSADAKEIAIAVEKEHKNRGGAKRRKSRVSDPVTRTARALVSWA
jgi:hypothetical protein